MTILLYSECSREVYSSSKIDKKQIRGDKTLHLTLFGCVLIKNNMHLSFNQERSYQNKYIKYPSSSISEIKFSQIFMADPVKDLGYMESYRSNFICYTQCIVYMFRDDSIRSRTELPKFTPLVRRKFSIFDLLGYH